MSQTLQASTLLTIALAPLAGSVIAGIWGTKLGGDKLGRTAVHRLTILGVLISFVLSALTLHDVVWQGAHFNDTVYTWMSLGDLQMEVGFMVDGLTAVMMCVVTFVSLMVHIYTIGYMEDDEGYNRFFAYISLFTFAMLMLVMSNNLLQLFFGWEAVGLVSYLLIGFWFNKPSAVFANMKAFLVNRVGDFGFILGIGLIAAYGDSLDYLQVFAQSSEWAAATLPGTDWSLMTVICICLFIGAMGKSAQFPLHVWLPDSMEGPTPISALIHAATMVTAGIFMVARLSPLFEMSDTALNLILVVGSITALFMGFLGIVQNDIKRVVAYSTLSQLGYMTVALGASAYSVAVFHLMTHAFFKALLFLGAGSVIIGVHHNQDMRYMGGLSKRMPITWITSLLGSLALIGTPFFSGFYSKDSIIEAVAASHLPFASWAHAAVLIGVFVTAFYSFRMYFMVFHGDLRADQDPHAHHAPGHDHSPHESPWVVTLPLVLLAVPSVALGYFTIEPMLFGSVMADAIATPHPTHPAMSLLHEEFHSASAMAIHALTSWPFALALAGVITAFWLYVLQPSLPAKLQRLFQPLHTLLSNKYFLDDFNEKVLARATRWLANGLWRGGDQRLIDGWLVNGAWRVVGAVALVARRLQTGFLYHYAFLMVLGMFLLITWFVWLKP